MKKLILVILVTMVITSLILGCSSKGINPAAASTQATSTTNTAVIPASSTAKPAPVIFLKLSSTVPETSYESIMGKWWGTELEKRSNGRVKIDYFFAASLVKTEDSLPSVSKGIADVQFVQNGYFPTQLPLAGAVDLIYQTKSFWVASKCFNEMSETYSPIQKMLKDNNIKNISSLFASETVIGANKPITKLEDLKGLKIRAMGPLGDVLLKLGSTPVSMTLPEVYEALSRGTIDAFSAIPYQMLSAYKLSEVTKYVIDPSFGCYASGGYYMNLDTWNKLPDDIKSIVNQIDSEFVDKTAETANPLLKSTTELLLKNGANISTLSSEEQTRWKSVLLPGIYDTYIKKMTDQGLPGKETMDLYQNLIKKYAPQDKYIIPYPSK